jgi:dipeptidyl aminopeptidase/acylaminoacyl peptidase
MTVEQSELEVDETLVQLANLPTMAQATVSEDGTQIALYNDFTGRNELHVLDVETGELSQWSDGEVPRDAKSQLAWHLDGDRVFFHHDSEGNEQFDIHTIDRDGSVETVLETDGQTGFQDIGPDGERLLVASNHGSQMNLYVHDMTSDETTKVTDNERATHGGKFSPDGKRFAYMTNKSDEYNNFDVFVAEADGSNHRNLNIGETGAEAMPADWHPAGDKLLVVDNSPDLGRCGVYDFEGGTVEWYGTGEYEEHPVGFRPGGDTFIAGRNHDATELPVLYDVETGECRLFDLPDGVVDVGAHGSYTLNDGRVVFTFESPTRRPEVIAYDPDTDEHEVLIEADYGPFEQDDFADAEYLTVDSDGVPDTSARAVDHDPYEKLEIGVLLYDSGERPSPLIVHPHGGPRLHETKDFDVFTQFLVSRGYSVLQVNFRGSTGRGREFVEKLYDDWGGAEQGDVATAAEHVIETRDWIDEDRIVMYGRSFGGYSAYWQAVQYPDLYDTVISWVGVSDLKDMHDNTMPHFRSELMVKYMGDPKENADRYEERSPVTHVENIEAPLLMMHGVNDRRVPVSQARLMDEALQEHGYEEGEHGDYEYVELGEEGHSSSDIRRKIRVFSVLDDFLDRRLGTEM